MEEAKPAQADQKGVNKDESEIVKKLIDYE